MNSCIYEGRVRHSRQSPAQHSFDYRVFMMYLDLEELPRVFARRWLWSTTGPAPARFRREDHIGEADEPLDQSVRELVYRETGRRPAGPVRLLTNLAYFGYCFNPVSFYYCFDASGKSVEFIVAEVNNTPWGETNTYVLCCEPTSRSWRFDPKKKMHVSPFMPMDIAYDWALSSPEDALSVYMAVSGEDGPLFHATMALRRRPITARSLSGVLLRYPLLTLKVILGIHWQALRLWAKGCPVYDHPGKREEITAQ